MNISYFDNIKQWVRSKLGGPKGWKLAYFERSSEGPGPSVRLKVEDLGQVVIFLEGFRSSITKVFNWIWTFIWYQLDGPTGENGGGGCSKNKKVHVKIIIEFTWIFVRLVWQRGNLISFLQTYSVNVRPVSPWSACFQPWPSNWSNDRLLYTWLNIYFQAEVGAAFDTMKLIKSALDPKNILNPGKVLWIYIEYR